MTRAGRHLLAAPLIALALGGCGSDEEGEPIPPESVTAIEQQLANIRGQIEQGSIGACNDIKAPGDTFDNLEDAVASVPDSVDADVRDALEQSVDRLGQLVDEECGSREEETETTPQETQTITIETLPEEPPPEETVPEETTPDEVLPPVPDDEDNEGGTEPGGGGTGGGGAPVPGDEG